MSGTGKVLGSTLFPLDGFGLIYVLNFGGDGVRIVGDLLGIGNDDPGTSIRHSCVAEVLPKFGADCPDVSILGTCPKLEFCW